ncbi:MAG: DEAD/DEAH box helicase family protein [Clostridiales bacterium]|nr:DEAD/DEAH box helicase family protein [Clostridiales bacterium]
MEVKQALKLESEWKIFKGFLNQENSHGGIWWSGNRYILGRHFGAGYISDIIRRSFVQQLQPSQPVFISAQTGSGKSTLIYETILPLMNERGQRVLILSSRSALDLQIKKQIMNKICPELCEQLTVIGISKRNFYGFVAVWTYQSIWGRLQQEPGYLKQFGAVILDEAHYFESDAAFNIDTFDCLKSIVEGAHHALRFYLTATPDYVFDEIVAAEFRALTLTQRERIGQPDGKVRFLLFDFERDYGYLDVVFFNNKKDIIKRIEEDDSDCKWIIFTSQKEEGKQIFQCLGDKMASYLDSETKKDESAEVFEFLVDNQKFDKKVLIATKVLDVGVNIWDKKLATIVIDSMNMTDFVQMIGRKRINKNENVKVYIKMPSSQSLGHKLGGYLEQLQRWEKLKIMYNSGNIQNFSALPFPFFVEIWNKRLSHITCNPLSFINLKNQINEIKKFLAENDEERAKHFLSWLNKKNAPIRWLNPPVSSDLHWLTAWLKSQVNVPMDRAKYDEFQTELTVKLREKELIELRKDRNLGIKSINNFFSENNLPFEVKSRETGIHLVVEV